MHKKKNKEYNIHRNVFTQFDHWHQNLKHKEPTIKSGRYKVPRYICRRTFCRFNECTLIKTIPFLFTMRTNETEVHAYTVIDDVYSVSTVRALGN